MEKGGLIEPDIDKGCLHAWEDTRDPALIDVTDNAPLSSSLDEELCQGVVF